MLFQYIIAFMGSFRRTPLESDSKPIKTDSRRTAKLHSRLFVAFAVKNWWQGVVLAPSSAAAALFGIYVAVMRRNKNPPCIRLQATGWFFRDS